MSQAWGDFSMQDQAYSSQLALFHRTSHIVSSDLPIDAMLEELIAITSEVTRCDACLIYLPDHATDEVVLRASQLPHTEEIGHVRLKMGEGVTGWVAKHKSVVALSQNAFADSRFKHFSALIEDTYEAFLSVPLVNGGEVIGVLNAHHKDPHVHTPEEVSLLSFLGEQIGGAIAFSQLAAIHSRLQEETLQIKEQLEVRKLTERAKGILQQRFRLSEREAYQRLRDESRRLRKPLRAIVEAVLLVEDLVQNEHPAENRVPTEEN
jgi:signal transduction protein with GAF and PtsI domain